MPAPVELSGHQAPAPHQADRVHLLQPRRLALAVEVEVVPHRVPVAALWSHRVRVAEAAEAAAT